MIYRAKIYFKHIKNSSLDYSVFTRQDKVYSEEQARREIYKRYEHDQKLGYKIQKIVIY